MSLQTIIDNATYLEIDRRQMTGSTLSRSGHYKTADRNVNVYSFTVGMHNGLTYSTSREILENLYTTGSNTEANISFNNNTGMNYITAYQGDIATNQLANISTVGINGDRIYIDQTGATGSGTLYKSGDFIQPKGNTDTYRYPYQVKYDVAFNSGSANTTVFVHRPVLSQDGVALTSGGIKVGNDVTWRVKITNLPKYTIAPHDRLEFSADFELIEVIS
jgi:hypothetical protein